MHLFLTENSNVYAHGHKLKRTQTLSKKPNFFSYANIQTFNWIIEKCTYSQISELLSYSTHQKESNENYSIARSSQEKLKLGSKVFCTFLQLRKSYKNINMQVTY